LDNNTLESLNRVLKTEPFSKNTSIGLGLNKALTVVHRMSRDMKKLAVAPCPKKETWVKAQKFVSEGIAKLGYKLGDALIIPSEKLIQSLPGSTQVEKRKNISVWIQEFGSMMKNPATYYKVVGNATTQPWDFDTLMDYVYSFWVVKPLATDHLRAADLAAAGIVYVCSCPQFAHYFNCKHAIGYALYKKKVSTPVRFSAVTVGKRKAPVGPKLNKRAHCLCIDDN